jgi:hypothetical protein
MIDKIIIQGAFDQFNYLQTDLDFPTLWDKINLQLYKDRKEIHIVVPVSILSISCIQSIINLILGLRKLYSKDKQLIIFSFTKANVPDFLDIKLLPNQYIDMLEYTWSFMVSKMAQEDNPFAGFTSLEITDLEQYIDYMQSESQYSICEQQTLQYKFYQVINDYDFACNKNFCATFPYMIDYYNLCETIYNEQKIN